METVEYKTEIPAGLALGRNKFVGENGKMVRVDVVRTQLGAHDPEKIASMKAAESATKEELEAMKPEDRHDYKRKKGLLAGLLSRFKDEDSLRNGFIGYKITRRER
jgi:hypothetical protein